MTAFPTTLLLSFRYFFLTFHPDSNSIPTSFPSFFFSLFSIFLGIQRLNRIVYRISAILQKLKIYNKLINEKLKLLCMSTISLSLLFFSVISLSTRLDLASSFSAPSCHSWTKDPAILSKWTWHCTPQHSSKGPQSYIPGALGTSDGVASFFQNGVGNPALCLAWQSLIFSQKNVLAGSPYANRHRRHTLSNLQRDMHYQMVFSLLRRIFQRCVCTFI